MAAPLKEQATIFVRDISYLVKSIFIFLIVLGHWNLLLPTSEEAVHTPFLVLRTLPVVPRVLNLVWVESIIKLQIMLSDKSFKLLCLPVLPIAFINLLINVLDKTLQEIISQNVFSYSPLLLAS